MEARDFEKSPSGKLVPTVFNQMAFVPNPLPPRLDLNKCMLEVDRASRSMAELKGMSYKVTNPNHLINPLQKREALASSSIEGTYTTASQLLLFDALHSPNTDPDTREVANYSSALQAGLKLLRNIPISSRLIKTLHAELLKGVTRQRGAEVVPGEFKRDQNFIGSYGMRLEQARFVPAPPALTADLMSDLEKFINSDEALQLPPVILNALVHYQFETIHPFPDGNGRVGRLLVPLLLNAHDIMPVPLLYISPFIEKNKDEYINRMYAVSKDGAWEDWIVFFSNAIESSSIDTMNRINKIADLRESYIQHVQQARASALLISIIDILFDSLVISIPQVADKLGITYTAAKANIGKLSSYQILKLLHGRRPKLFYSPDLFSLIFEIDIEINRRRTY